LPTIKMGGSSQVHTGDPVLLLGFPDYAGGRLSWTEGVIATHGSQWIKSDAAISHGHSGGMMLNERGELIGVLSMYERTSVGGGLALARPVAWVRTLVANAQQGGWAAPPIPSAPAVPGAPATGELMMVLGVENLNLRDEPNLEDSSVLGEMSHGTVVQVLQEPEWDGKRYWYYVRVQGGVQEGWASGVYLAPWEVATSPILFTSDRAGSQDIYRILPDKTGLARLTDDPGDEGDPSWSPGRDRIVFTANRGGDDGDIYIMDSAGGPWTPVTIGPANDLHPTWSPDGQRIAFVSDRDGDWELFVVNVDGTGLQQVTFNDAWDSFPAWSPDSKKLVYTSRRTGNYDLFLLDLETRSERQLTSSPYSDAHPSWKPDGDEIVYTMVVSEGGAMRREIGMLNVHNPIPQRVTEGQAGNGLNSYPDWSPDGQWIVFTSEQDGNAEIYLVLAASGRQWAVNLTAAPTSLDSGPVWSQ
ncbi:MAG TPA: hypothetical protein ENN99_02785, partial [Chloroflexi bacterium]|nr:hypothetical protein [Chloroflexota bacterium]